MPIQQTFVAGLVSALQPETGGPPVRSLSGALLFWRTRGFTVSSAWAETKESIWTSFSRVVIEFWTKFVGSPGPIQATHWVRHWLGCWLALSQGEGTTQRLSWAVFVLLGMRELYGGGPTIHYWLFPRSAASEQLPSNPNMHFLRPQLSMHAYECFGWTPMHARQIQR